MLDFIQRERKGERDKEIKKEIDREREGDRKRERQRETERERERESGFLVHPSNYSYIDRTCESVWNFLRTSINDVKDFTFKM